MQAAADHCRFITSAKKSPTVDTAFRRHPYVCLPHLFESPLLVRFDLHIIHLCSYAPWKFQLSMRVTRLFIAIKRVSIHYIGKRRTTNPRLESESEVGAGSGNDGDGFGATRAFNL